MGCCFSVQKYLILFLQAFYWVLTTPRSRANISSVWPSWSGLDSVSEWWRRGSWQKWKRWSAECERDEVVLSTWDNWPRYVWRTSSWACCLVVDLTTLMWLSSSSCLTCSTCPAISPLLFICFLCCVFFRTSRRRLLRKSKQSRVVLILSRTILPHAHRFVVLCVFAHALRCFSHFSRLTAKI